MASFLLGLPFTANRIGGPTAWTFRFHTYSWYVQDTFRANAKLTLNFGLRWEPFLPMQVANISNFDMNRFSGDVRSTVFVKAPLGFYFPGDFGFPESSGPF